MLETEDFVESQATQTVFESCEEMPIWARMNSLSSSQSSTIFDLRKENSWFGRDRPPQEMWENFDFFIFTKENVSSSLYDRISKCHFTIEKLTTKNEGEKSAESQNAEEICPAVLVCKGRNGVFLNGEKIEVNDRRILSQGDVIKLGKNKPLFKFQYLNIPPDVNSMSRDLRAKYFIGKEIGAGGCGLVRLIYNLRTFDQFAMKIVKKEMNPMVKNRQDVNEKIINEVNIMRSLHNMHVLGLIDFFETESNVIIVMEYLKGRDLLYRITRHNPKQGYLSENDAKFFFLQICRGLKYLHESNITHRDIKPDNILLVTNDENSIVKISDFGLSKTIAQADMKTVCGTQLYVAPEVLKNRGAYNNKVDIWSMGCLLYAMLSGSVPFCDAYGPPDLVTQIKNAKYSFHSRVWKDVSTNAKNLIAKMLQKDPHKRLSVHEILQHEWLKCPATLTRLEEVYKKHGYQVDENDLELTFVNVSLNDTNVTIKEPPFKKRRIL